MITMFYCEQYPKVPPNGWSEDSWRKDTTERLHRDSLWHLEGWQLNLMFFQDLAENEIRFRTTRKRPEENSESEFIELKLKNSNSIVNFMLTMITMFYCEQYPKVPPNGWSEDSWRKDTTERLHRDSGNWTTCSLKILRRTKLGSEPNEKDQREQRRTQNRSSLSSSSRTQTRLWISCSQWSQCSTVSNILKCHQMGGLKTAGARTQQNGCIGTVCGILKGGNWTSCSFKILRRKKLKRKRSTGKRPEENSESEFIDLKLKNSNSIANFMLTMITMFYCEQYPKVPPNGWSEDSWRKDTTERLHRDSLWHLEGWQLNLMFFQDLAENEIRFRTTRKRPEENSESEFIELKLKNSNSIVNFMLTMITMFYCEQYPKVPPNGWSEDSWRKDTTERLHRDSLWHLEGWQLNLMFFQDLAENEIRFRTTRKRPEENSESEFIELKLKNSNSIVNFMPTMITMFYCEQYPKVPPNGWSEDSWRKDTTERLHRDSLWRLEGWTTEVKDMSCSEKMVLDFQNTPVAFSSNRLPISLCSVFQQPLSQLRQFFQATTKYGWCRCEAVCGRPYLKNNLGEVLIKFHSTSKRIPDAPGLVCPLKSCSSVWNAIASSKFHGSAVRILKAVPQGVTKPLDLALVALLEQPRTTRFKQNLKCWMDGNWTSCSFKILRTMKL